ncbi:MAG TPA: hypothetical protein VFC25_02825 [Verrucomicrobiae bacterium]|nr:hypothetical protein [Verrucomicrobiae bacterium]
MSDHVEFHDSDLLAVEQVGRQVRISLDAYVHRWEQVDGCWKGTGWLQRVTAVLDDSQASGIPEVPVELSDGVLRTGSATYDGLVPLPFSSSEPASLELTLQTGAQFRVAGVSIAITSTSEARYLEDLPDTFAPSAC